MTIKTKPVISTTSVSDRQMVAKVESDLWKAWRKCTKAEETTKVLGRLHSDGVGTNDLEAFEKRQARRRLGKGKGDRVEGIINLQMKTKLQNSVEWEVKVRKERDRIRLQFEKMTGRRSTRCKTTINKIKDNMCKLRRTLQRENEDKVKHIRGKVKKKEEYQLPEELSRYSDAKIYKSDEEMEPETLRGPVTIVGGKQKVSLNEDEITILTRGPKYAIRRILNKERFLIEMEKALVKEKWSRRKRQELEDMDDTGDMTDEEKERIRKVEEEFETRSRQIYDGDNKRFDYGNKSATDAKGNKRVTLPKALSHSEEAELEVRRIEWIRLFDDLVAELEDEDDMKKKNITKAEERGLKSLKKRVADGELVICQTDKSGRFAVLTLEQYEEAGMKHVSGDEEVNLAYVKDNERQVNGHCNMVLKIFRVGKNWRQEDRNKEVKINHGLAVCPMYVMFKDHKGWTGHMGGPAPSRPIASSSSGNNMHFSELMSEILEPVAAEWNGGMEVISGSHFMSKIDKMNEKTRQEWRRKGEDKDNKSPCGAQQPQPHAEVTTREIGETEGAEQIPPTAGNNNFVRPTQETGPHIKSDSAGDHGGAKKSLRGDRMRQIRDKMESTRKKKEQTSMERDITLERKRQPKTWRGQRLVRAKEVSTDRIQDKDTPMVCVGSDVEALYPSLEDVTVAEICFTAIMETEIEFDNINYKEAARYCAMNMRAEECQISPLKRVLPWRAKVGGMRPGVTGVGPMGPGGEEEPQWDFPDICLTKLEKRMLVATVVKIGILVMMTTHIYSFADRFFLQKRGGPIGLRATCAVARIVMLAWDGEWLGLMKDNMIEIEDSSRYMDDVRAFLHALREGWRWFEGELCYCDEWEKEDKESGLSPLARTTLVLRDSMTGIYSFIKMTMETAEDFVDNRLPTLDIKIWVTTENIVLYTFYEKPMCSNQVIQKDSAVPENIKISSLGAEVQRRMLNTSKLLPDCDRVVVVDNLCQKLANSGYGLDQIRRIVTGGLKGYEGKVRNWKKTGGPFHTGPVGNQGDRNRRKLSKTETWFKKKKGETDRQTDRKNPGQGPLDDQHEERAHCETERLQAPLVGRRGANTPTNRNYDKKNPAQGPSGNNNKAKGPPEWKKEKETGLEVETSTVMFIDETAGGTLGKRLRGMEDRLARLTGFRVRFTETGGTQLRHQFPCTNIWKGSGSGLTDCPTCQQGDEQPQNCFARNLLYESHCSVCSVDLKDGKKKRDLKNGKIVGPGVYVGETSRSLHERMKEHFGDSKSKKRQEESHMYKHWENCHPDGTQPAFKIKTIAKFKDCLTRQLAESVRIQLREEVLNSKSEYSRCHVHRLVIEKNEQEEKKQEEKRLKRKIEEEKTILEEEQVVWGMENYRKRVETSGTQNKKKSKKLKRDKTEEFDWGSSLEEDNFLERWVRDNQEEDLMKGSQNITTIPEENKCEENTDKPNKAILEERLPSSRMERDYDEEDGEKIESDKETQRRIEKQRRMDKVNRLKQKWTDMNWKYSPRMEDMETEYSSLGEETEMDVETGTQPLRLEDENSDWMTTVISRMVDEAVGASRMEIMKRIVRERGLKMEGKRKRYDKGRWTTRRRKSEMEVDMQEGWKGRVKKRGRRRIPKHTSDRMEALVDRIVNMASRQGWSNNFRRDRRMERAKKKKLEWLEYSSRMDWTDEIEEKKRNRRLKKAGEMRQCWWTDHIQMD